MKRFMVQRKFLVAVAVAILGVTGCSKSDVRNETVAQVGGEGIKVKELREFMGIPGGVISTGETPVERKKEALGKLIDGRILAQEARAKGLDNTSEFRDKVKQSEDQALLNALFQKEVEAKLKISDDEIKGEAKKLQAADNNLPEKDASARARMMMLQTNVRKLQEEIIAAAKKEVPSTVDQAMMGKIGKGEKVAEDAVLATVGSEKVTLGDIKKKLQGMSGGAHGGRDLSSDPNAIRSVLERDVTGKTLIAYAKKQNVEGSEWAKAVRQDLERVILIEMLVEKDLQKNLEVTDKEVADAYKEHAQMLVRDGKQVPLAQVREQLKGFIANSKRKQVLESYIEGLRKKAKITRNEETLSKV